MASIVVDDVSKRFRLYKDRARSIKEGVVARGRGEKRYEEFWALHNVSMTIDPGSTYAFIGHNGSGKSTLLRCIAGIYKPTSGRLKVEGRISALLELGSGFHPDLSGRENVYLNASILGLSKKDIDAVFDDIVDFSGIGGFIDAPVKVYSSGMYVRLGFSVAVHVDPEILIIDEVVAVGDEEFQRKCFDHLYELRQAGVTIVMVSHNLGVVQSMCDHATWFDHGRVVQEGKALDVVTSYVKKVNQDEERERGVNPEHQEGSFDGRRGSGEIRISDIEFFDEHGESVAMGTSGKALRIRLHYDASEPIRSPIVGVVIHHDSGVLVGGTSTMDLEVDVGTLSGRGHVDVEIPELTLNPGTFEVGASVHDTYAQHVFDAFERGYRLPVRPEGPRNIGLVGIDGHWTAAARDRG